MKADAPTATRTPRAIPLRRENAELIRSLWGISVEELKAWGDRGCPAIKRLPSESANGTRLVAIVALVDLWLASLPAASSSTPPPAFQATTTTTNVVPLPRGRVTRSLTNAAHANVFDALPQKGTK